MSEYNVPVNNGNDEIPLTLQDGIQINGGGGSNEIWLPNVSEQGEISWSKSSTSTAPTPRNIKGADGADGQDGAPGQDGQDGADGLGIKSVDINGSNHLIVTYDDDTTHDAGEIPSGGGATIDDTTPASNKVYSSAKIVEDYSVTKDLYADELVVVSGAYNLSDGSIVANTNWCRTKGYVPKDLTIGMKNVMSGGWMMVQAFNAITGAYIGRWNGSAFTKSSVNANRTLFFDWSYWHKEFPDYAFTLNFQNSSASTITPSDVYAAIDVSRVTSEEDYLTQKTVKEVNNYVDFMPSGAFVNNTKTTNGLFSAGCADGRIYIYGSINANGSRLLRLTDTLSVVSSATSFSTGITLKANRKYVFTLNTVKGARKTPNDEELGTVISVYPIGADSSIGTYEQTAKTFKRYVEVASDTVVNVCIYIHGTNTYNCECYVTMEDITGDSVLSYYQTELNDTIQKVRAINDEPSLVFPVVTDIHRYKASVQTFPQMIENIKSFCEKVKCDFIANLGDTIEGDKAKDVSLGQAYDCIGDFANIGLPFFYTEGNHDNNPYISSGALVFTLKQCYGGFFTATKGVTCNVNENGTDYYFDFTNLGVRYISLNSCNVTKATNYGFGDSTAAWLEDALDTDNAVILATHVSPIKERVWDNIEPSNAGDIKSALTSFVTNGGKLIVLTGHSHIDAEFIAPIEVTNVCQKFEVADTTTTAYQKISGMIDGIRNPARTQGEATEDAWTVCVYKPGSNEFDCIRFGAGVDRYIHCDYILSATTVTSRLTSPTWHTSDANVATVSNGAITIVGSGYCAIYAKDTSGNIEVWTVVNV